MFSLDVRMGSSLIHYFLRQDYPEKELLVVDDGPDAVGDLIPADPRIRYIRLPQKITLGAKLNLCCAEARGPLIAQWDDDDWYGSDRLSRQMEAMSRTNADVCGISDLLYLDLPMAQSARARVGTAVLKLPGLRTLVTR